MRNRVPMLLLCASLVAAGAGCSDRDSEQPISSTEPSVDAPAMPDPVQSGPVSLEAAFGLAGGQPRQVDPDELEAVAAGMSCSLDSVNGGPVGEATVDGDAMLVLSGWFQHGEGEVEVVAVAKGEESFVFPMVVGNPRPDVAEAIGATTPVSDLTATTTGPLPAGEYAVYYVRKAADGLAKCVSDRKVRIG